jgi:IAA-amino acid hydrolase
VVSVGFIEGGQAGNVIPETVRFGGTLRSMTSEGLSYLMQRIKEVFKFFFKKKKIIIIIKHGA